MGSIRQFFERKFRFRLLRTAAARKRGGILGKLKELVELQYRATGCSVRIADTMKRCGLLAKMHNLTRDPYNSNAPERNFTKRERNGTLDTEVRLNQFLSAFGV